MTRFGVGMLVLVAAASCGSGSAQNCDLGCDAAPGVADSAPPPTCQPSCTGDLPYCDEATGTCVECLAQAQCPNDEACRDNRCESCLEDAECDSSVCGTFTWAPLCERPENIVYIATTGVDGGPCSQQQPCRTLAHAVTRLAETRLTIRLEPGDYVEPAGAPVVFPSTPAFLYRVMVVGGDATIRRTDGGRVLSSATEILVVRDLTIAGQAHCSDGDTSFLRVNVAGGSGPLVHVEECAFSARYSSFTDSPGDGIVATAGRATVEDSVVANNAGDGMRIEAGSAIASEIANNGGIGFVATSGSVERSLVHGNAGGGIHVRGYTTIRWSLIYLNGGPTAAFGGVRIDDPISDEFFYNTVAYNEAAANTAYAGGLYCGSIGTSYTKRASLIFNNVAGTNDAPLAQASPTCDFEHSLVGVDDGTNQMRFVSPTTTPYDFHLEPTSPAVDAIPIPYMSARDIDNELRPYGSGYDIGGDEYFP